MHYQQYAIKMELTGITRKRAAEIISETIGRTYAYDRHADTYSIKDSFERSWLISSVDDITCQRYSDRRIIGANSLYAVKISTPLIYQKDFNKVSDILNRLQISGAITNDSTKLFVMVDASRHTEKSLRNLANMMESKGDLIYKAVESKNPSPPIKAMFNSNSIICFPMFNSVLLPEKAQSYVHLASAMNHLSITQNNISPKKNESPNEKFTFRTWLIRLGMVGQEFKSTRAILLENLVGNSAWKNPEMAQSLRELTETIQPESFSDEHTLKQIEPEDEPVQEQGMVFGSM